MNGLEPYTTLISLLGGKNKSRSSLYSFPCQTPIHFQPKARTTIFVEFSLFNNMLPKRNTNFRIKVRSHKLLFISKSSWGRCFYHHNSPVLLSFPNYTWNNPYWTRTDNVHAKWVMAFCPKRVHWIVISVTLLSLCNNAYSLKELKEQIISQQNQSGSCDLSLCTLAHAHAYVNTHTHTLFKTHTMY